MKWLIRIVVALIVVFGLLSLGGYLVRRSWGRDVTSLEVKAGERAFHAQRDEMGVWQIRAGSPADLWFAFGYVQAVDREFQTELLRHVALGRLGELVGRSQAKRDRYMRLASRVARDEWDHLPTDSVIRQAAEAYVAGRKSFLAKAPTPEPIEYRLFGITRASFDAWEPWQVLAISRFHTWEFSYDFQEESRTVVSERALGADLLTTLFPADSLDVAALYAQPGARASVQSKPLGRARIGVPEFFSPVADKVTQTTPTQSQSLADLDPDWLQEKLYGTDMGASNAWLIGDSRSGLGATLCNDTHLGFSWPSPLFPIRYRMEQGSAPVEATGYMLPGLPAMVIGAVDSGETSLAWGITMAAYADVADLVSLDAKTLARSRHFNETYRFRDAKTGVLSEEKIVEEWTDFGPRVDDFAGTGKNRPLALDWLGYRRAPTVLEFFLRRNLQGTKDLREDLSGRWVYPAVNFFWLERDAQAPTVAGHIVTGLLFDRTRTLPRRPVTEAEARARRLSQPAERPWFERRDGGDAYFVVSGNQKVWPGELSRRTAGEWLDGARAEAILASFKEAVVKPEAPQTDFKSPSLVNFLHSARKMASANRLCAEMGSELILSCQRLLSEVDGWNGGLEVDAWVPSVVAGWYARTKAGLWPVTRRKLDDDVATAFLAWHRSNASNRALIDIFTDSKKRQAWEKASGQSFNDLLIESFRDNLEDLVAQRGPITEQWAWGDVHRIGWQHPAALAPEPIGTLLRDGLFGPPPEVPGGLDSPGRMDFSWSPDKPLEFPVKHGAVMRFCANLPVGGRSKVRWANATGSSGNPFSIWAKKFAADTFFKGKLFEVKSQ